MAEKTQSLKGFLKGLISVTNRFSTPKGANIQLSNLLLNERGALQTCDGSAIISQLPGGNVGSIIALSVYVDPNPANLPKVVGLVPSPAAPSNHVDLWNFSTNPATLLISLIVRDPNWNHCQMFNFAGQMVITLGPDSPAMFYTEPGGLPTITQISTTNLWQPNHPYRVGDMVQGNTITHGIFAFQVVKAGSDFADVQGGVSGAVEPTWPFPVSNFPQPGVVDNTVLWKLYGPSANNNVVGLSGNLALAVTPLGSAHGISHEGFLWFFGTSTTESGNGCDGPMSLRQSHLNSATEWPGIYAAFVGKDDGQVATGVGSFTIAEAGIAPQGGLVLFKEFSTYNVTGSFQETSFAITPVKTDLGCVAPRSIQFVPGFGLMRLTHMGVALYDGVQDQLVSEDIRSYIFGGFGTTGINWSQVQNARSTINSNPPMFLMAIPIGNNTWPTRILCYDLILKVWTVVDLPFQISSLFQARIPTTLGQNSNFQAPVTYMGGANDGIVRRWQAGDTPIWDTGKIVDWSLTTPEIGSSTVGRLFFKQCTVRLHAPQASPITFQPIYGNLASTSQTQIPKLIGPVSQGPSQGSTDTVATYEGDLDLAARFVQAVTGQTERIVLSGVGRVTIESIELDVVEKPSIPLGQPV